MARIVVKFGGSSLADGEKLRNAARSVAKEAKKGHEVVVVVSAMGKTTNALLDALEGATAGKYTPQQKDDVAAMGERTSVRVMSAAIESLGVSSCYVEPTQTWWCTVTDSRFTNATVNLNETKKRTRKHLVPMLKDGVVPVVCGFLGIDREGNVTTMGRGGSDTTAVILGSCLDAQEVIIVTDVDGVFSGDPRIVDDARLIKDIDVSVLWDLAVGGAKVMKWDSLIYKGKDQILKIVNNRHADLSAKGTEIKGEFMKTSVKKMDKPLGSVTLVGKELVDRPGLLAKTSDILGGEKINIWGVTVAPDSMTYFINEENVESATKKLHDFVLKDKAVVSVTSSKGIGLAYVTSPDFLDEPGALGKITGAIGDAGLNIKEVTTSKSQIMVFVDYKNLNTVYEIMSLIFGKK